MPRMATRVLHNPNMESDSTKEKNVGFLSMSATSDGIPVSLEESMFWSTMNPSRDLHGKEDVIATRSGSNSLHSNKVSQIFNVETRMESTFADGDHVGVSSLAGRNEFYAATTPIVNIPQGWYNVDVAATFRVPLTTIGDLDVLTKDIEAGKHKELLSGITNDKRMAVMDISAMCDLIEADNSPNDPIVQYVYIHEKPSSYVGAAGGSK
ncbi:hypothetical protein Tco_0003746 [Tanacetum coccineum]